ncbi:MAG: long-chain fatty acid--CoA ligase [Mycobacteriales bacterium]
MTTATPGTLCAALADTVRDRGDLPAYSDRHGEGGWRTLTWGELYEQVLDLAAGLVRLGLQPGDTVALMASNRTEHVLADLAVVHAGGTPMTVYATLAPAQVAYIAQHSTPSVVVLEGADQLARWAEALEAHPVKAVVVIDEDVVTDQVVAWSDLRKVGAEHRATAADECEKRIAGVVPEQPLTILYTSGTTGSPKGVVLTHRNVLFEAQSSAATAGLVGPGRSVSYLPFAHIAERVLGMYIPQVQGGHVYLLDDPAALPATLAEVRPTRFFGVPRVWEKVMAGVSALLAAKADDRVTQALASGLAWVEAQENGGVVPPDLAERFAAADEAVLRGLRALLGLDQVEWAASAAAPMPLEVARFFAGLGIVVYDVYGMTETCGSVTANSPGGFRLGSVGRAQEGIEVVLADDGEILVRGPVVTPGYFRAPEATADLIDEDGWVRTGDIGRFDEDGYLYVIDRKKEMIITSSGKNVAPSNIENLLKESPLVGHAYVAGDAKPYVVALLTLDPDMAPVVAAKMGVDATGLRELSTHPQVLAAVQEAVDAANARLSRPEQVKRFALLSDEWTAESEELTPTLKLKRRVVSSKYDDVLAELYA